MPVRGHREGTKRSDGRWQTSRSVEGREKVFVSRKGESLRQLTQRANRWQYESRDGDRSDLSLARAVELFLEFRSGSDRAESTKKDDRFAAKVLLDLFGPVRIGSVDPVGVDLALRPLQGKPRTAQKVRAFGRMLYKWLMARSWAKSNPFQLSTPIRYEPEVWEEVMPAQAFEEALRFVPHENMRALLTLLRWTAIRPKAARELTWFEVQDDGERMYVAKARAKSRAGRRPVFVRPEAADLIRSLPRTSEFVFPSTSRRATWSETHLLSVWKSALRSAGFEGRKVYDLKHLRASELLDLTHGDAGTVARIIGVSSPSVLEKNYRQFKQRELDEIASK